MFFAGDGVPTIVGTRGTNVGSLRGGAGAEGACRVTHRRGRSPAPDRGSDIASCDPVRPSSPFGVDGAPLPAGRRGCPPVVIDAGDEGSGKDRHRVFGGPWRRLLGRIKHRRLSTGGKSIRTACRPPELYRPEVYSACFRDYHDPGARVGCSRLATNDTNRPTSLAMFRGDAPRGRPTAGVRELPHPSGVRAGRPDIETAAAGARVDPVARGCVEGGGGSGRRRVERQGACDGCSGGRWEGRRVRVSLVRDGRRRPVGA